MMRSSVPLLATLVAALLPPAALSERPCDIYGAAGTPCAAAHSVVRSLFTTYDGRLYQLKRSADNATLDIRPSAPGGVADGEAHAKFCDGGSSSSSSSNNNSSNRLAAPAAATTSYPTLAECVIHTIYDQTGNGNHLLPATPAINNPAYDLPVNATRHPITINGSKAYGAYFETGMGYRALNTSKVATGNDPETIFMVTSGTHLNQMCCFDYGSSENQPNDHTKFVDGAMESVYFGTGYGGGGKGPWIGMDMENGIYGGPYVAGDPALLSPFVAAMAKGGTDGFAIKGGDARGKSAAGGAAAGAAVVPVGLKKYYDGPRPKGYQPMHKTGAIILGVGGDNAAKAKRAAAAAAAARPEDKKVGVPGLSVGTFYEGVLTVGYTSDAADDAVMADIVAAGYGL